MDRAGLPDGGAVPSAAFQSLDTNHDNHLSGRELCDVPLAAANMEPHTGKDMQDRK